MKNKLLLTSFTALCSLNLFAQNPAMIVAPKYSYLGNLPTNLPIPQVNNDLSDPYDGYDGQAAKYVQNIQLNPAGNLLFFVIDDVIYDKTGKIISYIDYDNDHGFGSAEVAVIPNPANCSQYYILTTTNISNFYEKLPLIVLLDISLQGNDNAQGDIVPMPNFDPADIFGNPIADLLVPLNLSPPFLYGQTGKNSAFFFASSKIINNSCYVFISNKNGIYIFKANGNGFNYQNRILYDPNINYGEFNPVGVRGELEVVHLANGNLRLATQYYNSGNLYNGLATENILFTCDLNSNAQLIAGSVKKFPLLGYDNQANSSTYIKGLEFSPNGQILYVTHSTNPLQPNPVEYYDFQNPTPSLVPFSLGNGSNLQHSQIEMDVNGNLIFAHQNGLAKLSNPNTPNIANFNMNYLQFVYPSNDENRNGTAITLKSYVLQDNIDGMDYSFIQNVNYDYETYNASATNDLLWEPNVINTTQNNPLILGSSANVCTTNIFRHN